VVRGAIRKQFDRDVAKRRLEHDALSRHVVGGCGHERLRSRRRFVANRDRADHQALRRNVSRCWRRRDLLCDVDAVGDAPKHGVLAVERRLVRHRDEKLGPAAVTIAWHQHRRHGTARVLFTVRFEAELAKSASTVLRRLRRILRQWIAALDDPHRDHAVERGPVVRALTRTR
jgi:hypothetical protein